MNLPAQVEPDELPAEDAPPLPDGDDPVLVEVVAKVSPPIDGDDEMMLATFTDTVEYAGVRLRMNAESIGRTIEGPIRVQKPDLD